MQPWAFYLLKVIACSGILLLYYRLALRNKRFHYYNRFYLLMAMAASLLLPLLKFNWFTVESSNKAITFLSVVTVPGSAAYTSTQKGFSFASINWQLLPAIVYTGVSLLLIAVLFIRITKIYRLKKKFNVVNMAEFDFINTDLAQAPFSFLHNLFWRDDIDMNEATGRQVLLHELTHIRQKHTWDKLWMQIITSVLWANPFFWFIQKELYMLHEFIADEKAIENNDGAAFAAMLLTSQYGKNTFSPAQQFSYSPIKRRLFMLTNLTKPRYSYARRLMVLPLLASVVLLFAFRLQKKDIIAPQTHTSSPIKIIIDAGHGGTDDGAVADGVNEKDITLKIANKIKELSTTYGVQVLLTRSGDYTVDNKERITFTAGENVAAFISIHADYVAPNVKLSNAKEQQGIEAFVTKQNAYYSQSALLGSAILHSLSSNFKASKTLTEREQPAYILSHNNLPALLLECGWMNNATDLKQMTDDATVELMARKILEGVVAYANNTANIQAPKSTISFSNPSGHAVSLPLLVLNGKIVDTSSLKEVFKDSTFTFTAVGLIGPYAVRKYGNAGKHGVLEFSTNKKGDKDIFITGVSIEKVKPQTAAISENGSYKGITITDVKLEQAKPLTKISGSFTMVQPNGDTIYVRADSIAINPASHNIENTYQGSHGDSVQPATFPGGHEAWEEYLVKQLRADIPAKKGAPVGVYTAIVVFTVDANGNLSQVKAEKDPGYGTGAEAVRVIQRGPKWIPAKREGQPITVRQKQSITFQISE